MPGLTGFERAGTMTGPPLLACNSSWSGGGSRQAKAPAAFRRNVSAALSNGPDPIRYAESQIAPLGGIHVDLGLHSVCPGVAS